MPSQPRDRYVGTRIREYDILDVIGKGGMGAVYRARHVFLDEERAIKVIHSEFARDEAFVQRFIREAKMLSKLNHPNLVQLYEFGMLEQDVFFMVMELITGESLLDRVNKRGKLPISEAIKIIREAAHGLHAAHQKNIVHRDISPDNLLIVKDQDGSEITKVIDFGIAKPLADQTRIFTRTNMFLGKPEYCSPEQCGNLEEGEVIDHRSDIYSLGITLYFTLTGKLPFYASTAAGYLVKHVSEMPKSIATHFPSGTFPPQLEKIISKSLEKKREQRYATMKEFADALNEYKPAVSAPVGASREVRKLGPGSVFERRYKIESVMRTSSRGTFYKALDTILNQPIILKILQKETQEDPKIKQRLKRTLLLSRQIHHPNVCSLYDIGESEDSLFLTMQYIEGTLLSDFIQGSKTISPDIAFRIMKDLISAVSELHSKEIIHRNLKTRNVMIDSENHAHIFDFANARSEMDPSKTEVSSAFGASPFTAPEIFTNKPLDRRADIYALGVILFQLITGTLPYKGESLPSIIFSIMNKPPIRPSDAKPGIHPELEKVIMKAIDKDPDQRYQTAQELLKAIEVFEKTAARNASTSEENNKASAEEAKSLFEQGKELYNQLRLEEAIDVWRRAGVIRPDDDMIQKCLMAAESRLKRENQVRDEVKLLFSQCEAHLDKKEFEEAKKILDACDKKITSSPRFRDLRDRIYALWKRMDVKAERKPTENYNSEPLQSASGDRTKKSS